MLSADPKNLMDSRFSSEQRAALQAKIRTSLTDGRPLSLVRPGDGEAYPYKPPEIARQLRRARGAGERVSPSGCALRYSRLAVRLPHYSKFGDSPFSLRGAPQSTSLSQNPGRGRPGHSAGPADIYRRTRPPNSRGNRRSFPPGAAAHANSVVLVSCWQGIQSKFLVLTHHGVPAKERGRNHLEHLRTVRARYARSYRCWRASEDHG